MRRLHSTAKDAGIGHSLSGPTQNTSIYIYIGLATYDEITGWHLQLHNNTCTETDLPGEGAMQYGDEEALGCVEGREEIRQEERRSRQEHQARGPVDTLQEQQCQRAHCPCSGDISGGEQEINRICFFSDRQVQQAFTYLYLSKCSSNSVIFSSPVVKIVEKVKLCFDFLGQKENCSVCVTNIHV